MDAESSVLQLPDTIEESLAVDGDHSSMVKFKHKGDQTYKSVVRYLEDFTSYSTQIGKTLRRKSSPIKRTGN